MYVRGINNVTFLEQIPPKCEDTVIGIVWSEMRSKDDTLSMWRIENREDFDDAALSIVLPKYKIDKASFLIIEDSAFAENNIEIRKDSPDKCLIRNSKAEHYNMINIRAGSAADVLHVYRSMYEKDMLNVEEGMYIISWTSNETGDKILNACEADKINTTALGTEMLTSIENYKQKKKRNN